MHRFKAHAAVAICLAAIGLSAGPAFGAPAVPDHVDLPPVASAAPSVPDVSPPRPAPPIETPPPVETPPSVPVETPDVEPPAAPRIETPDVDLPAASTTSTVTDRIERTVEAATGSDVGATVERVVTTGDPVGRLAETVDETVGSAVNLRPVADRVDRAVALTDDRDAAADAAPAGATPPLAPGPARGLIPIVVAPAGDPAASALPLLYSASSAYSGAASDGRAAARPAPAAPGTGGYASAATAAAGSSAPPSAPALPIALALLALLALFAFKEAPAFLRPAPFVALLERPG